MSAPRRVTPMIHVPDVAAAVAWYRSVGFKVLDVGEDDGEAPPACPLHGVPRG